MKKVKKASVETHYDQRPKYFNEMYLFIHP